MAELSYTQEDVQMIVKELLKYDDVTFLLSNSDMEDDKEYGFDSSRALEILTHFAN